MIKVYLYLKLSKWFCCNVDLKKTCPPGFKNLNIFVATAAILSGWMADSTKINVTTSSIKSLL